MSRYAALQRRAELQRKAIMQMSEKQFLAQLPYDTVEHPPFAYEDESCVRCNGGGCGKCEME
jgi:hypothetical protein